MFLMSFQRKPNDIATVGAGWICKRVSPRAYGSLTTSTANQRRSNSMLNKRPPRRLSDFAYRTQQGVFRSHQGVHVHAPGSASIGVALLGLLLEGGNDFI